MSAVLLTGRQRLQHQAAQVERRHGGLARPALVALAGLMVAATWLSGPAARAADWPGWRGPAHNSTTPESSGWEEGAWPLGQPAWTRQVGVGATSPIVAEGRVYVLGWDAGADTVRCLDAATGEELWRQQYPCPEYGRFHHGDEGMYHGPSSTPSFDGETGLLYTLSLDGDLRCWNARAGGEAVWALNLYDAFGVGQRPPVGGGLRDYGYTTAPLVWRDWVIVEVGSTEGNLMAFDKRTGERRWASQCTDPAGHSGGPIPLRVQGIDCVAVFTLRQLLVVRLDAGHEGETLATYPWQTDYGINVPSPTVVDDCVVLTSGYNRSRLARIRVAPDEATLVWEKRVFSVVGSPVYADGRLYLAYGQLRCLDYESGEQLWAGGTFGDDASCLVTGDGRVLVWGKRRLALVESAQHSPDAYRELAATGQLGAAYGWPHPALADGRLYVKDLAGNLFCFVLKPPP